MNRTAESYYTYEFVDGRVLRRENPGKEKVKTKLFEDTEDYDNSEAFEKLLSKKQSQAMRRRIVRFLIVILLTALALSLAVRLFCNVATVRFEGSGTYSDEALFAASGITLGDSIFSLDKKEIERRVIAHCPAVKSVEVKRQFPSGVTIRVTEDTPVFYTVVDGEAFLLSSDLRLMKRAASDEETASLVKVAFRDLSRAFEGEKLQFHSENQYDYLRSVFSAVTGHELGGKITAIDVTDKFDIRLVYENRLVIRLGSFTGAVTKLTLAKEYIATLSETAKGVIDASDTGVGSFYQNDRVDLSV